MTWYFFQLIGMFTQILEAILDKKFILQSNLNGYQTSFLRLAVYTIIVICFLIISGESFKLLFEIDIFIVGFFGAISSLMYSTLVKHHDISILIIVPIIIPIFFYVFDFLFLGIGFSLSATFSLFISLIGSYIFLKHHINFKKALLFNLGFMLFYSILEFYIFKNKNINPMLFFGNTVLISAIVVGIILIFKKQFTLKLFDISYIKGTFLSKMCDVILTICYGYAILETSGFNFSIFQLIFAPLSLIITYLLIKLNILHEKYLIINKYMLFGLLFLIFGEYLMFLNNVKF